MTVCRQVEGASFLALEEVVLGGAAGKGLLTSGPIAEIVLFVRQLPYRNFAQWLPHILETLSPVLEHQLESIKATPPAERFYFYPALIKERNEFVGRQSQQTKVLVRLLTWWASK